MIQRERVAEQEETLPPPPQHSGPDPGPSNSILQACFAICWNLDISVCEQLKPFVTRRILKMHTHTRL